MLCWTLLYVSPGLPPRSLLKKENGRQSAPQRLKPHSKGSGYGTAEAVPLSKTEYVNKLLDMFEAVGNGIEAAFGEGVTAGEAFEREP